MSKLTKIFAMAIIAVFLAATPIAFAANQCGIVQVVFTVKYDDNYAKPSGGGGAKPSPDYKIWFKGYKTEVPAALTVYTQNDDGLSATFVSTAVDAAAREWDDYTSADLVGSIVTVSSGSGNVVYDNKNSMMFGTYSDDRVIAVTYAWVNRATRQLVEFDILFNAHYTWGDATKTPSVMDLQNIATHELGHGFNLNDIYDQSKSALTMYGYSSEGDTEKRTLEPGDILGIQAVFGP